MTQTLLLLQAFATIALTWGTPLVLVGLVYLASKGRRFRVEARTAMHRTATYYWTHRGAVRAARQRTERTGILFSVNWTPLV